MIGTPHEISWNDKILFLEDIGETPYRLDRFLTHLSQAGCLQKIRGFILGTFTDDDRKEKAALRKSVTARIVELCQDTDIPIWENFPTGHSRRNLTLPVGLEVEMDSRTGTLSFHKSP